MSLNQAGVGMVEKGIVDDWGVGGGSNRTKDVVYMFDYPQGTLPSSTYSLFSIRLLILPAL